MTLVRLRQSIFGSGAGGGQRSQGHATAIPASPPPPAAGTAFPPPANTPAAARKPISGRPGSRQRGRRRGPADHSAAQQRAPLAVVQPAAGSTDWRRHARAVRLVCSGVNTLSVLTGVAAGRHPADTHAAVSTGERTPLRSHLALPDVAGARSVAAAGRPAGARAAALSPRQGI